MFINGLPTYSKEGKKLQTGLIVGRAAKDGQIYATQSGKEVGSVLTARRVCPPCSGFAPDSLVQPNSVPVRQIEITE